jgi:hypothetical protein
MVPNSPNSGSSARQGRRRVGLSPQREQSLKQKLRFTTCSEPWIEAQFKRVCDQDEKGFPIVYRYHDPHIYPPGGEQTAMIRCPKCGVFNPPGAIEHGCCLDHADHRGWGPSPSALAFQALQRHNLRVEDNIELQSEETDDLRQEILKFKHRKPRLKKRKNFS